MTTPITCARFTFGTYPAALPLTDQVAWDDELVRAAGFDPNDDEIVIAELSAPWEGHPAGSRVVLGLTVEGHPFAIEVKKPVATPGMNADDLRGVVDATGIGDNTTARAEIAALAVELECTEHEAIFVFEEIAGTTIEEIATPWYRTSLDYWRRELSTILRDGWQ